MEGLTTLLSSFSDLVAPLLEVMIWIFPIKIYRLDNGEKGVIKTWGMVRSWRTAERGPGVSFCFIFEEMVVVQAIGGFINLPEQTITTKDNKVVICNGAVEYTISNVQQAMLETEDIEEMLCGFSLNQIREYGRTKDLEELLDSEKLTRELVTPINRKIKIYGSKIERIMITDLRPHEVTLGCDTFKIISREYINSVSK